MAFLNPGIVFQTSHTCLTAEGASEFARAMGVPEVRGDSLIAEYSRMQWEKNLAPDANPVECQMWAVLRFECTDTHYPLKSRNSQMENFDWES